MFDDGVEFMDTSDTPCSWFYKAECGVWQRVEDEPFSFMSSAQLETYYIRNPYGVINMTTAAGHFQINLAASIQVNLNTGQTRQIKRTFLTENGFRCKCVDLSPPPPAHWENLDPKQPYQVLILTKLQNKTLTSLNQAFPLRRHTSEYQAIECFVRNIGLLDEPIDSIFRIQNKDLWELFCRKKIQLMRIKGQSAIEEQNLFHGTRAENLHSISTFNFNCRLSDSKRGLHLYGKGTYFAKYASYAFNYSKKTNWGTKIIVLARVIVGNYTQGHEDYCTPNDDQDECIYDSCVDDPIFPKTFAIFDSNQIYPEYVLQYRCTYNFQ
ncbi:protein mono-ADP-ribosyltransferase PARP11 [Triplophysa rosa]|uniref:protein mono-ADP-ribosyltransferase PARP11 n=1 Tax=Triplophysa rosa TaxID=992332 RepID=UPI0025462103|nr:protein mono-ADP-ribosyltransferase PARP11 [Triplophysa rosa]